MNIYNLIENFISDSKILNLDNNIIKNCVIVRKNNKIKLPDAIIAATAITNNFTLITRNEKDFDSIKELKILNLFK